MRPAFNLEPKYRVTVLTREEWTRGTGTPNVVEGLVWFTVESKTKEGTRAKVYGQSVGRRLSVSLGKCATVFQAEIYAILACAYEIQTNDRPKKCVNICSDSQAALKALRAAKTMSPLVRQCQKALNDISTRYTVGLNGVPGHAGVRGNEIADKLARDGSVQRFVGPEPSLGVSRQNIRRKIRSWLDNQNLARRRGLGSTQGRGRELISGPSLIAKTDPGSLLTSLLGITP
jgi:ribonuclease HI